MINRKNVFMQKIIKKLFLAIVVTALNSTSFASDSSTTNAFYLEEPSVEFGVTFCDLEASSSQELYSPRDAWFAQTDNRFQSLYLNFYQPNFILLQIVNKCLNRLVLYQDSNAFWAYASLVESVFPGQGLDICAWAAADMSQDYTHQQKKQIRQKQKDCAKAIVEKMPDILIDAVFNMQLGNLSSQSLVIFVADLFAFIKAEVVDRLEVYSCEGGLTSILEDKEISIDLYSLFEELLLRVVGLANSIKATVSQDNSAVEAIDRCMQQKTEELMHRLATLFQVHLDCDINGFIPLTGSRVLTDLDARSQLRVAHCFCKDSMPDCCSPRLCLANLQKRKSKRNIIFSPGVYPYYPGHITLAAMKIQKAWRAYNG
jgi:hypothetical protein